MALDKYVALTFVALSVTAITACSDTGTPSDVPEGEQSEHVEKSEERLATTDSEYHLAKWKDPDITDQRDTELWARVYRPATLVAKQRYPVLVFLHGNHNTCSIGTNPHDDDTIHGGDYIMTGACPTGYSVVLNHEGYQYIADDLASSGYIVVSINSNLGVQGRVGIPGDPDMIHTRGKLVLKHLAQLSEWDRGVSATPTSLAVDLKGHLDFSHVGLLGHSRGGEGVREAYDLYGRDATWVTKIVTPVTFEGIFEIAPTDSFGTVNPTNTRWAVLLPMCDGDLAKHPGMKPFDRVTALTSEAKPSFKSTLSVWGTNHDYYNTEWQTSDSFGCTGTGNTPLFTVPPHAYDTVTGVTGSDPQRQVGKALVTAFFRGNVGAARNQTLNSMFDPRQALPTTLTSITRVDRGFLLSPDSTLSTPFASLASPDGGSVFGPFGLTTDVNHLTATLENVPDHDPGFNAYHISWSSSAGPTTFQINIASPGSGALLNDFTSIDFRVDRADDTANPSTATDFKVQLVAFDGSLSQALSVSSFVSLTGPAGTKREGSADIPHSDLQTVRLPFSSFLAPVSTTTYRGVRFTFDSATNGSIYLGDLRLSKGTSPDGGAGFLVATPAPTPTGPATLAPRMQRRASEPPASSMIAPHAVRAGHLVSFRRAKSIARLAAAAGDEVAIEVESEKPFPVHDAPIVLHVGDFDLFPSELSDPMDARRLVFTLRPEEQRELRVGDEISVTSGLMLWRLGSVTVAHLAR